MTRKISLLLFTVVLIFTSCKQKENNQNITLKHQTLMYNNYLLGAPHSLALLDTFLIVADHQTDSIFHVINANTGMELYKMGHCGQGPNEFLLTSIIVSNGDSAFFYDLNKRSLYFLTQQPCNKIHIENFDTFRSDTLSHNYVAPIKNQFIATGVYLHARFCLLDYSGKLIDKYSTFPYKDEKEKNLSGIILSQVYLGRLTVQPGGNRFACAQDNAKILTIFSVSDNKISLEKEIIGNYPEYRFTSKEYCGLKHDSPYGYMAICASKNYIYTLYSGKSYEKYSGSAFYSTELIKYNWQGEEVGHYYLDVPCSQLCVTPDDKTIYAISYENNPEIVKFEIPIN